MKAERIFQYGPPDVIQHADVPIPEPGGGELLISVKAAGVGPWDALVREGRSAIPQKLPLTLGSDIAGIVEATGPNTTGFRVGDEVYGLTNEQFTGGYAEYAIASAERMARKPESLSFLQAASAPVVSVTAWQMLFDYAHAVAGQKVLIHGAAGNVGAYAVQLAQNANLNIFATASSRDAAFVQSLGASTVVDYRQTRFENVVPPVDIVLDTVGGDTHERSFAVLKPDGILVSIVSPPGPGETGAKNGAKSVFLIVDVTTARLNTITTMFDSGILASRIGTVLRLEEARIAHEMLAGAPHAPGKIVLNVAS